MGHERLGHLPTHRKKWKEIVDQISQLPDGTISVEEIVENTAKNIDNRFRNLCIDKIVQSAFTFLIALSVSGRDKDPYKKLRSLGIDLNASATPIRLGISLRSFINDKNSSLEYSKLVQDATIKTLSYFYKLKDAQGDLFHSKDEPFNVWKKASNGSGFCDLSRQFFANLTSGYFKYILDREASSVLPTVEARENFKQRLNQHIEDISHHSFETAKITQSFAAGWYNKHAIDKFPSTREIKSFIGLAGNKIRETLLREARE